MVGTKRWSCCCTVRSQERRGLSSCSAVDGTTPAHRHPRLIAPGRLGDGCRRRDSRVSCPAGQDPGPKDWQLVVALIAFNCCCCFEACRSNPRVRRDDGLAGRPGGRKRGARRAATVGGTACHAQCRGGAVRKCLLCCVGWLVGCLLVAQRTNAVVFARQRPVCGRLASARGFA